MLKITKYLFLISFSILFMATSCDKDENGSRTWEMEMSELDEKIKDLEEKGIDIDTTNMSVFYYVMKEGEGPMPKTGDSCLVSYVGFLPDGTKFEDSWEIFPPDGVWRFKYKPQHKVSGLVNALGYMNKGSQIEIYVTSDNAFGSKGTAVVPPYTTLIYRAQMRDLFPNE